MSELIEKLRSGCKYSSTPANHAMKQAADEIERLQQELAEAQRNDLRYRALRGEWDRNRYPVPSMLEYIDMHGLDAAADRLVERMAHRV